MNRRRPGVGLSGCICVRRQTAVPAVRSRHRTVPMLYRLGRPERRCGGGPSQQEPPPAFRGDVAASARTARCRTRSAGLTSGPRRWWRNAPPLQKRRCRGSSADRRLGDRWRGTTRKTRSFSARPQVPVRSRARRLPAHQGPPRESVDSRGASAGAAGTRLWSAPPDNAHPEPDISLEDCDCDDPHTTDRHDRTRASSVAARSPPIRSRSARTASSRNRMPATTSLTWPTRPSGGSWSPSPS